MKTSPLILLAIIGMQSPGESATVYDIGNGGNWTAAATWNPNIAGGPTSVDFIQIQNIGGSRSVTLDGASGASYSIAGFSYNESDNVGFAATNGNKTLQVNGDFSKSGSGTLTFDGQNPAFSLQVTGQLAVSSGTLTLGNFGNGFNAVTVAGSTQIASGAILNLAVFNSSSFGATTLNGTLNYRAIFSFAPTLTFAGLEGTGALTVNDPNNAKTTPISFTQSTGSSHFSGNLTEGATQKIRLSKAGAGTQILSGTNQYSGTTTVSAGTLQFGKQVSLYNGSTAAWTDANLIVNSGATLAFNVGGTGEFTAGNLDTLKALGTASGGFRSGSILGLDTTNATGGSFAYSSNIANPNGGSNVLGLAKLGTNTLVLSGQNTYSGGTSVRAGTLLVNNAAGSGTGTGSVSVLSSATLGGTGSISGAVSVAAGAALMGGSESAASDDLALGGNVTLANDSTIKLTLGAGGLHSSLRRTGGTWVFDSDQQFFFASLGAEAGLYDNLISGLTGSEAGLAAINTWTISNVGWSGAFSYDGAGGVDLLLIAIPEPASVALLALAGAGMLAIRRRHALPYM